jgi:hypothetical protein
MRTNISHHSAPDLQIQLHLISVHLHTNIVSPSPDPFLHSLDIAFDGEFSDRHTTHGRCGHVTWGSLVRSEVHPHWGPLTVDAVMDACQNPTRTLGFRFDPICK